MIVGGVWVPTPVDDTGEWTPTEAGIAAAQADLDEIQARHEATCRRCPLCSQLVSTPDDFGLCHKTSVEHTKWRRQVLAREKVGIRRRRPAARAGVPTDAGPINFVSPRDSAPHLAIRKEHST